MKFTVEEANNIQPAPDPKLYKIVSKKVVEGVEVPDRVQYMTLNQLEGIKVDYEQELADIKDKIDAIKNLK